ncbi:hypothetical protein FNZ56_01680 [Pseudoluteimonas lycopersici]|uniref:Spore coat protein U domain-containing protein n=1 Tax=Pseudoluteimonas lycopersici TaxID=1324796 RepID=A0A516V2D2_9GAMM|nr:hypothetical protein [Lysobacter lycopersici]QDQ72675.1 hypothetical protein FNZ56_01680 [Lysobacter lycopersici]
MRSHHVSFGSVCLVTLLGLAIAPHARSATTEGWIIVPGGNCQLSIPTTNTAFRPKATGARNESASISNFVICPFVVAPSDDLASPITGIGMWMQSLDGTAHSVTCTAVVGALGNAPMKYSSKTVDLPASTTAAGQLSWFPADFGYAQGAPIPGSGYLTITCNLPPQTSINYLYASYYYEIGS